jgi:hypothetical protein
MSFNFRPMTEEELDKVDLIDNGIYQFEVIKSTKRISEAGNDMAELNIRFWDKEGNIHTVFDYLVFSDVKFCIRKIKHFCEAVGLVDQYTKGELPEEFRGYSGYLELGIQDEMPNPKGGFYPKKNIVIDYVLNNNAESKVKPISVNKGLTDFKEDDVPF